jgi:hypothetical protein
MGFGRSSVSVGAWVVAERGTKIHCTVDQEGEEVEVSFRGSPSFELTLSKDVLEQCIVQFPVALLALDR